MGLDKGDGLFEIGLADSVIAARVHRLQQQIGEVPAFHLRPVAVLLRPDQFQFVARALNRLAMRFRADTDPVDRARNGQRPVGFDGDEKTFLMEGVDQSLVHLQHRFAAGQNHESGVPVAAPCLGHCPGEIISRIEATTAVAVQSDKIGIAELADCLGTIPFESGPEIASGETDKNRPASGVHALALKGQESFFYRVAHGATYRVGSTIPASSKPFCRKRQLSQRPHGRFPGAGS